MISDVFNRFKAAHKFSRRWVYLCAVIAALLWACLPAFGADAESRKQEILQRWNGLNPPYAGEVYDEKPSARSPYTLGKVANGCLREGLQMFNFLRFLSGLPDDVEIDPGLVALGQHGAVLLAASE